MWISLGLNIVENISANISAQVDKTDLTGQVVFRTFNAEFQHKTSLIDADFMAY